MPPAFLVARSDIRWSATSTEAVGRSEGVSLEARRRWWGKRWTVTSEAPFPVPEPLLLFASRKGMDHGFWRDFRVGDAKFDLRHFVFSDTPALLPFVVGFETRAALGADTPLDDSLTLYVRGGMSRVTGTNHVDDTSAIERHLEVHRALARDQRAFLATWAELVTASHGRAEPRWPPTGTVMNPVGVLRIYLSWTHPTTREVDWMQREDSLRTNLAGNDERMSPRWSVREAEPFEPSTFELERRRFTVTGKPTIPRSVLDPLLDRGKIVSIVGGAEARVSVRGLAIPAQLATMERIIEQILKVPESGSPYR